MWILFFPEGIRLVLAAQVVVVTGRSCPSSGLGSVTSGPCHPFPRSTFHRPGTAQRGELVLLNNGTCGLKRQTNNNKHKKTPTAKHKANQQIKNTNQNKAQTIKLIKSQIQLIRKTLKTILSDIGITLHTIVFHYGTYSDADSQVKQPFFIIKISIFYMLTPFN